MIRLLAICILSIIVFGFTPFSWAQEAPAAESAKDAAPSEHQETPAELESAPVVLDGVELFKVRGTSAYPAKVRARIIAARIAALAANKQISTNSVRIEDHHDMTTILAGKTPILGVVDADAALEAVERPILAETFRLRIVKAIKNWRHDRSPPVLRRNALFSLLATLAFLLMIAAGCWIYRRQRIWLRDRIGKRIPDLRIQKFKVASRDQLIHLLSGLNGLFWLAFLLVAFYLYLEKVLSLFPWTRGFAEWLYGILFAPVHTLLHGLIKAIPDLIFLLVLFYLFRYVLKVIRAFFTHIAEEKVSFKGFESEWAWPTYRLVRIFLVAFGLVIAYPYIPGSDSGAFKGLSIFFGVLVSFGSTSLIGNLIAGYTMTYRRAFRIGDRIRVGNHLGDVQETRLLVTYLRTPKNEEIVIPNSLILNGEIINYSTLARDGGLILHSSVGIGYETPWRQVEAMLIEAARRTSDLKKDPPPFVLQTSLGDFCITYEINAYCLDPKAMERVYAELHRNIQDIFNEYEVQIMTPAYMTDPAHPKVVSKKNWFAAPARPPVEGEKPIHGK